MPTGQPVALIIPFSLYASAPAMIAVLSRLLLGAEETIDQRPERTCEYDRGHPYPSVGFGRLDYCPYPPHHSQACTERNQCQPEAARPAEQQIAHYYESESYRG